MYKWLICLIIYIPMICFASFSFEEQTEGIEFDMLFFDSFLSGYQLDISIDTLTKDYETFYFSLDQIIEALNFQLVINIEKQQIQGWFLHKGNQTDIHLSSLSATIAGKQLLLQESDWVIQDEQVFLSKEALKKWFSISSELKASRLLVNFITAEPHPKIARLERERQFQRAQSTQSSRIIYPLIDDQYHLLSYPLIDTQLSSRWSESPNNLSKELSLSISGVSDILYHGSQFQYAQSKTSKAARLKLYRHFDLGYQPYYYEFGDIIGLSNPFLSNNSRGLGFILAESESSTQQRFTRRFEGPAPPDWEAELYRDETVIDYQVVDNSGFYLFENIPVSLGRNFYKVILYGPAGEQQEIEFHFNNAQTHAAAGEWRGEFSYHLSGRDIFFYDNQGFEPTLSTQVHYGLNRQHSISLGYIHQQQEQELFKVNTFNFAGFAEQVHYQFDAGYKVGDNQKGYNTSIGWLFKYYDLNLTYQDLRQLFNNDRQANLQLLSLVGGYNFSLGIGLVEQKDHWVRGFNVSYGINKPNFAFSSTASYQDSNGSTANFRLSYPLSISSRVSWQNNYSITPRQRWQNSQFTWRTKIKKISLQFASRLNFQTNRFNISSSLSHSFTYFRLGAQLNYDNTHTLNIGLNFSLGNAMVPGNYLPSNNSMQRSSTIEALTFYDENYNGIYDDGDLPIAEAGFKGKSEWKTVTSDSSGWAILPKVKTNSPQKIELNRLTLDDPLIHIPQPIYQVNSHPGGITRLYFPLQKTIEIEGEITLLQDEKLAGQGGVPLQLRNKEGVIVKQVHSEFDGFYLFEKVLPGYYDIIIEPQYLIKYQLIQANTLQFNLTQQHAGDVFITKTIQLQKAPG